MKTQRNLAGPACLLALVALLAAGPAGAAPLEVQGYLTDLDGAPCAGEFSLSVGLYGGSVGGVAQWGPVITEAEVVQGHFSLALEADDDGEPTAPQLLDLDGPLFVEISILDEGDVTTLEPRMQLFSVPWSLQAGVIDAETQAALRGEDGVDGQQGAAGPVGPAGPVVLSAAQRAEFALPASARSPSNHPGR